MRQKILIFVLCCFQLLSCKKNEVKIELPDSTIDAIFTITRDGEYIGQKVNFISSETNEVVHKWGFGDSTISYDTNPNHLYLDSGIHIIKHTVYNYRGDSISFFDSVNINMLKIKSIKIHCSEDTISYPYENNRIIFNSNKIEYIYSSSNSYSTFYKDSLSNFYFNENQNIIFTKNTNYEFMYGEFFWMEGEILFSYNGFLNPYNENILNTMEYRVADFTSNFEMVIKFENTH